MKWAACLLTAIAGVGAVPSAHRVSRGLAAGSASASTNGTFFNIDGTTKYYAGSNAYWLGFLTNDADVNTVMDHFSTAGLKIFRVWGFNDVNTTPGSGTVWYQRLSASGSTINTGADGLQRLDAVVAAAEKYDVKLIINFVNNWNDYGGMNAYIMAFGGNATTWYTNTKAQAQYQTYIQAVVSRYKNSSAIFAWELANEPRCHGCSTDVIFNWANTTSKYVKSLDPDHMVTLGDEGMGLPGGTSYPYTTQEGVDFVQNLGIETLDFGTFHWYPQSWGVQDSDATGWIQAHAAACVTANKPCLLEEYGVASNHCAVESPWQQTCLATTGMAGDMFWQFGDTISTGQTPNDGNTVYTGTSDFTCLVTNHVKAISSSTPTT